jgi:hypothetical protein
MNATIDDELRRLHHVELALRFERGAADYPDQAIETFEQEFSRFIQRVRKFAELHRTPNA